VYVSATGRLPSKIRTRSRRYRTRPRDRHASDLRQHRSHLNRAHPARPSRRGCRRRSVRRLRRRTHRYRSVPCSPVALPTRTDLVDGVATGRFVKSVLRGESTRRNTDPERDTITRLSAQAYGQGLAVGARARFSGAYRSITNTENNSTISEIAVCSTIELRSCEGDC